MKNRIELLNVDLLNQSDLLAEIDHWLKVFNWQQGWHYDLDMIWTINLIEEYGLKPGATILDAGGGLGMTQFLLAARGYNVISLDFNTRIGPKYSKGIFNIGIENTDLEGYHHEYMDFMDYGLTPNTKPFISRLNNFINKIKITPEYFYFTMKNKLVNFINPYYLIEKWFNSHDTFGELTFLRGSFNKIPLSDNKIDFLVSISAFEHNKYEDMPSSVDEFLRVLKPGAPLTLTTSAAEKNDWYFEAPQAWNFTKETLQSWFFISNNNTSFNYADALKKMISSDMLKKRISGFYKYNKNNALPYGKIEDASYYPVGIVKIK